MPALGSLLNDAKGGFGVLKRGFRWASCHAGSHRPPCFGLRDTRHTRSASRGSRLECAADSAGDALQTRGVSSEWGLELWARILGATGWAARQTPANGRRRPSVDECPRSSFTKTVLHHLLRDSKTAPVGAACLSDTSPRRDGGFSAFRASRAASYSPGSLVGSFSTRNQRRILATRLLIAAPHSSYRTKARTNSRCDGPWNS